MDMKSVQSFPLAAKLEIESLRAELEAVKRERDELVAVLKRLWIACPTGLECNSFHHAKQDQHGYAEECKPAAEYVEAIKQASAALAKLGADKTGENHDQHS